MVKVGKFLFGGPSYARPGKTMGKGKDPATPGFLILIIIFYSGSRDYDYDKAYD
jgi:hypothetical protein